MCARVLSSLCAPTVCFFVQFLHKERTLHTRSSRSFSIIYDCPSCGPAVPLRSLLLLLVYTTVPTAATLSCVMHSESNDLLSCITYLADVDLLDINRLGKNLLPPRPSVWLCKSQKCILCPLLGELGYCRLTMALSSRQLGSREVFPLGTEGRDPVLSQVCRFPSCLNYIWNSCLMA